MTGFIVGVLFINLWRDTSYLEEGLLNINTIERLQYFEVDNQKLFAYILQKRIQVVLLMALFATTVAGIAASYVYIGWLGISLGLMLATMTLQFGMKGSILFFCMLFPQYLVYIPMSVFLVNWCIKICSNIHFSPYASVSKYNGKKQEMIKNMIQFLIIIGVVIIGSFLECYVNPILLHQFVKIF